MKTNRSVSRLLTLSLVSWLLTLGSLTHSSTDLVHTSQWKLGVPTWVSDYQIVTEWGFPFGAVMDNPYVVLKNRMDRKDDLDSIALVMNWILWFVLTSAIYRVALAVFLSHRRRGRVKNSVVAHS
jgi:hypothetical protein